MAIEALLWEHPQWAEKFCGTVESMAEDGRMAIDEPDAEIVQKMFEMRAGERNLGAISK